MLTETMSTSCYVQALAEMHSECDLDMIHISAATGNPDWKKLIDKKKQKQLAIKEMTLSCS